MHTLDCQQKTAWNVCEVHTPRKRWWHSPWVRWPAVPVAAVAGAIVGYGITKIAYAVMALVLRYDVRGPTFAAHIIEFFAAGASALCALYFGCWTAPAHRKAVFYVVLGAFVLFNVPALRSLFGDFRWGVLLGLIGTAVGTLGATSVLDDAEEASPAPPHLSWDEFLAFLASESCDQIIKVVLQGDGPLTNVLLYQYGKAVEEKRIAPDTVEAADAAVADAARWDAAEEKVAELKVKAPGIWEQIVRLVPTITPAISESEIRRLERRAAGMY
jgi:hypothetical protein